jgi:hypothetical protein
MRQLRRLRFWGRRQLILVGYLIVVTMVLTGLGYIAAERAGISGLPFAVGTVAAWVYGIRKRRSIQRLLISHFRCPFCGQKQSAIHNWRCELCGVASSYQRHLLDPCDKAHYMREMVCRNEDCRRSIPA